MPILTLKFNKPESKQLLINILCTTKTLSSIVAIMDANVQKQAVSNFIASALPMGENAEAAAHAHVVITNQEIRNKYMKPKCWRISGTQATSREYLL